MWYQWLWFLWQLSTSLFYFIVTFWSTEDNEWLVMAYEKTVVHTWYSWDVVLWRHTDVYYIFHCICLKIHIYIVCWIIDLWKWILFLCSIEWPHKGNSLPAGIHLGCIPMRVNWAFTFILKDIMRFTEVY